MPHPRFNKSFAESVESLFRFVAVCGLMVWGVCNFWTNILAYQRSSDVTESWRIAVVFVLFTAVVPFLLGLVGLIRMTGKQKSNRSRRG